MSDVWRGITKDSYIVDISRDRSACRVASYVTKYASKPLNTSFANTPWLLDEAPVALKGRRLCFAFGAWYRKALTDPELDGDDAMSLIEDTWEMFIELEELLKNANGGSRDATSILLAMNAEAQWRATLTAS